jgi:hypothetical protein
LLDASLYLWDEHTTQKHDLHINPQFIRKIRHDKNMKWIWDWGDALERLIFGFPPPIEKEKETRDEILMNGIQIPNQAAAINFHPLLLLYLFEFSSFAGRECKIPVKFIAQTSFKCEHLQPFFFTALKIHFYNFRGNPLNERLLHLRIHIVVCPNAASTFYYTTLCRPQKRNFSILSNNKHHHRQ